MKFFFVFLIAFCFPVIVMAQVNSDQVKATYLYNFVTYVTWPGKVKKTNICIIGSKEITKFLTIIKGKVEDVNSLSITKKYSNSSFDECNILYVGDVEGEAIKQILSRTKEKPILSVSSMNGFVEAGGIIGFRSVQQQIKLEVNIKSMRESGVVIDSELLELMKIYN